MTKGFLITLGVLSISSSVFATYEPFTPDTLLNAGGYTVPCEHIKFSYSGGAGTSGGMLIFRDSLGREIQWGNGTYNSREDIRRHRFSSLDVDVDKRVLINHYSDTVSTAGDTTVFHSKILAQDWNDKGMITDGLMYRSGVFKSGSVYTEYDDTVLITLNYENDGVTASDTVMRSGEYFMPDTVIMAGEYPVSCIKNSTKGTGSPWTFAEAVTFTDVDGRLIKYSYEHHNNKMGMVTRKSLSVKCDDLNRITEQVNSTNSKYSFRGTTLVGEGWNSRGMITDGVIYGNTTNRGPGVTKPVTQYDTSLVTIVYDSDDVTPVDTVARISGISGGATALTGAADLSGKRANLIQNGRVLSIYNSKAGAVHRLYSSSGRLIQSVSVGVNGSAQMNLNALPAGMYLLKGMQKSHKIICR